jgi:hypothetical protein
MYSLLTHRVANGDVSTATADGAALPATQPVGSLAISYLFLRKTVGWIGSLLPIALIAGNTVFHAWPRPDSMSGYYYTPMRNLFVGALCALGVFLVAYNGYDKVDRWITNIAGFGAIGVAFCPTKPAVCVPGNGQSCPPLSVTHLSAGRQAIGDFHLFFAAVTFTALGLMALRFAKSAPLPGTQAIKDRIRAGLGLVGPDDDRQSTRKKARDAVYRVSGVTILSSIVIAALSNLLPTPVKAHWPSLFIFEALAVIAFGVSWFVKGQTLQTILPFLRD